MIATLIAAETRVVGAIACNGDLIIEGEVEGDITARGLVHLRATASVSGDVTARRVIIDDDALFEGRVRLLRSAEPATQATVIAAPKRERLPERLPPARIIPELPTVGRRRIQRRPA